MRTRSLLLLGLLSSLVACQDRPTPTAPPAEPALAEARGPGERVRVILELRSRADQGPVAEQARGQGARLLREYRNFPLLAIEVNSNALQGLARSPRVVSIMRDVADAPSLDNSLPVINADDVHALGWDGTGVTVAILDTGIDRDHPFVAGRVVEEACYSSDGSNETTLCPDGSTAQTGAGSADIDVAACQDGSNNICDHGMHVAGIAAGDGTGVVAPNVQAAGVAPGANIIAIQVFTRFNRDADCGSGGAPCVRTYTSDQIAGLDRVFDLRNSYTIAAANMSLGGGNNASACDGDSRKTPIDALIGANIATVIAAGNDGFNASVSAPGCISTAVTVGATDNSDNLAGFTNRGVLLDLFAPGVGNISSVDGGAFGSKSGTSMATPHVVGAWAVLRQAYPSLTVAEILTLLQTTGVDITYSSGGANVTTPRIDLLAAMQGSTDPPVLTADNASVTVPEGSSATNTGTFNDPDGDPVTLSASVGTVSVSGAGTWSWSYGTTDGPTESQTVTITGTDDKNAEGSVSFALVVENVAPVVSAGADATLDEGDTFVRAGSFTDPGADTWSATVDYGDGSGVQPLALVGKTFNLSHLYVDDGSYTVTVRVTDDDGGVGTDLVSLTVNNVAPTVDAGPDASVTSGETYAFSGSFSDPGVIDYPWTWTIDWGFGPDTNGSTNDQSAPIVASRQVCVAGSYNVLLSVTDKDGGTGTDALVLTVPYYAIGIDITPTEHPNPVNLGSGGLLPVAILSTATFDARDVDPSTVTLGDEAGTDTPVAKQKNGRYHAKIEDVNGDGRRDMVVMFETPSLVANGDLTASSTELVLRGFLKDGCTNFRGTDSVRVTP